MSSLGEVQQIYRMLQEIDQIIGGIHGKTERLRSEVGTARGEVREVEYLLYRTTSLLNRLGLPENIHQAISVLQRLLLQIRLVHSALIYLSYSTPYGLALALLTLGVGLITMGDIFAEVSG